MGFEFLLATSHLYLFYLLAVMICVGIIKQHNLFGGLYKWLDKHIVNKKVLVGIISCLSGVLPIPGRCVVSAAMLDTVATNSKRRGVFGVVDYLCTHHYYFWSPLEASVIIPIAALSLTYLEWLKCVFPLLFLYLVFVSIYLIFFVKEKDIVINIEDSKYSSVMVLPLFISIGALCFGAAPYIVFILCALFYIFYTQTGIKELPKFINWKLILYLYLIISAAILIKTELSPLIVDLEHNNAIVLASIIAFGFALATGSSSKFAGLVAIMCSTFGTHFLPMFFAIEFSGYMLSPLHKCVVVSKMYFGTSLRQFYIPIIILSMLIIGCGILFTL